MGGCNPQRDPAGEISLSLLSVTTLNPFRLFPLTELRHFCRSHEMADFCCPAPAQCMHLTNKQITAINKLHGKHCKQNSRQLQKQEVLLSVSMCEVCMPVMSN